MGYSLPMTDLSTAGLVASAVETGRISSIDIVDRNPDAVWANLKQIAEIPDSAVRLFGGDKAIEKFAGAEWREYCWEVAAYLEVLASDGHSAVRGILVYWDGLQVAAAVSTVRTGDVLSVVIDPPGQQWDVTSPERSPDIPSGKGLERLLSLQEFRDGLSGAHMVEVRSPTGATSPVLDANYVDMTAEKTGHGVWMVLKCPALEPPVMIPEQSN
ncbi:hypothetical protein [Arthrobacter bambusae]|uniref:hypothetical protein n=1 Tax=Arthrobacter bambusae TaxID=1338426 RepID=UPI00278B68BE|nr:hypothetical protein [Arthrobacter bambusae]MDQ0030146.1 hypothetical protein [Arthrobacter bambusae]MDQ0097829.1 hypothetical protein [Arthrobacter bambusae]